MNTACWTGFQNGEVVKLLATNMAKKTEGNIRKRL